MYDDIASFEKNGKDLSLFITSEYLCFHQVRCRRAFHVCVSHDFTESWSDNSSQCLDDGVSAKLKLTDLL